MMGRSRSAVLEGDLVQHQAFADVEADVQAPVLPVDVVPPSTVKLGPSGWVI